jgi:hypothetical protein
VPDLGANQLASTLIAEGIRHPEIDLILFQQNATPSWLVPPFAILNATEVFDYAGPVVATDLYTAECLIRAPGPVKKFFYVWDLEWFRTVYPYERLAAVYRQLPLIARCAAHGDVIQDAWNVDVTALIPDCNLTLFAELFHGST